MKNWIKIYNNNYINLKHLSQIYVHKVEEKFVVLGDIAGKERAYILSVEYDDEQVARAALEQICQSLQ